MWRALAAVTTTAVVAASCGGGATTVSRPRLPPTQPLPTEVLCAASPNTAATLVVPSVIGLTIQGAIGVLDCGGFRVTIGSEEFTSPLGSTIPPTSIIVVSQNPKPGKRVAAGTNVSLVASAPSS